jgi:hypothetical protein
MTPSTSIAKVEWTGLLYILSILYDSTIGLRATLVRRAIIIIANTAAIISQGLIIDTTVKTAIVRNPRLEANVANPGRTISNTTMSFEKRVTILPMGFESKNTILECNTALHIAWCMLEPL